LENEMTAKTVNYTPEQTAVLVSRYVDENVTVEKIAEEFGKSVRSIVAKLSREGVYKAKVRTTKTGEAIQKKDATADAIGAVLKMSEPEIESLTKANKTALVKIWTALANSKPA
jgi:(p)ppGpp synthase/HD superfamily hydrolase